MQPTSKVKMDEKSFEILKRTIRNVVVPHRERKLDPAYKTVMPEVVAVKLTNRCNLRCKHCYQWNESGYHHDMEQAEQNLDIDTEVFRRMLEETRETKSRLYLWGGEPLFHRNIEDILLMLENDPRETTICTNAYLIEKYEEALCRISPNLELLIAIEGFEKEHDLLRGKGSFSKVMDQIDRLLLLRRQGIFHGKISVHSVINDSMIGRLYELMEFFEQKGIDLVLLCFPWYISHEATGEMDGFFREQFDWLKELEENQRSSWHAFKYHIDPDNVGSLMDDLKRINERMWQTRIRYQPGLDFDEIEGFVSGNAMTSRCATKCLALSTRADITPSGNVSACKFFSEFSVGNLHQQSLSDIWNSEAYDRIRRTLGEQLSPACSKCNVLYLHGSSSLAHI
ncbi:radical SAM/SPASM domain-containing protein [Paenibacillus prosopidis]|uniref:Radical SAM protein with 4Fe4S-binding SPASM domain n=1 Tax=Paenibacillus prosopidis TaxID=630520 RepID=A0A368VU33_9BACL|nr:radical SAM protein [Paenibacillus prosopidis]RCW43486.1 radical SAM protein with 4Fe4S-binding SPASM domain [Paenibacillus prosopidis]